MDNYQVPVDNIRIGEPLYEADPVFHEDPIPTILLQKIPLQETGDKDDLMKILFDDEE